MPRSRLHYCSQQKPGLQQHQPDIPVGELGSGDILHGLNRHHVCLSNSRVHLTDTDIKLTYCTAKTEHCHVCLLYVYCVVHRPRADALRDRRAYFAFTGSRSNQRTLTFCL